MEIVLYSLITIITFVIMEGVAWLAHRYLMHGWLWIWHEDHHKPRHEKHGFFEKNDLKTNSLGFLRYMNIILDACYSILAHFIFP